jgi:hypothetical protein
MRAWECIATGAGASATRDQVFRPLAITVTTTLPPGSGSAGNAKPTAAAAVDMPSQVNATASSAFSLTTLGGNIG